MNYVMTKDDYVVTEYDKVITQVSCNNVLSIGPTQGKICRDIKFRVHNNRQQDFVKQRSFLSRQINLCRDKKLKINTRRMSQQRSSMLRHIEKLKAESLS